MTIVLNGNHGLKKKKECQSIFLQSTEKNSYTCHRLPPEHLPLLFAFHTKLNWAASSIAEFIDILLCTKKSHSFHAVSHSPPQPHHLLRPHHCRVAFPPFPLSPPFPIVVLQSCRSRHAAAALDWVCRCRCRCWVSVLADHTSSQLTACPLLALGGICRWG